MAKRPLPWSPERVDVVQKRGTAASLERFPPRTAFKWPRGPPPRCHRPEWCKANKRGQTNRHGEERQVDKKQGKKSRGSGDRGGGPTPGANSTPCGRIRTDATGGPSRHFWRRGLDARINLRRSPGHVATHMVRIQVQIAEGKRRRRSSRRPSAPEPLASTAQPAWTSCTPRCETCPCCRCCSRPLAHSCRRPYCQPELQPSLRHL